MGSNALLMVALNVLLLLQGADIAIKQESFGFLTTLFQSDDFQY